MKKSWKERVLNKLGYTEITYSDKLGNSFTKIRSIKKIDAETQKAILAYDEASTLTVLRQKANLAVASMNIPFSGSVTSNCEHSATITPEDVANAPFKEISIGELEVKRTKNKKNANRAKRVRSASN